MSEPDAPDPIGSPAARFNQPGIADRNLLFGILALQMDFITRDGLIAAMHAWVLDKTRLLSEIILRYQVNPKAEWPPAIAADETISEPVRERALQFAREWK